MNDDCLDAEAEVSNFVMRQVNDLTWFAYRQEDKFEVESEGYIIYAFYHERQSFISISRCTTSIFERYVEHVQELYSVALFSDTQQRLEDILSIVVEALATEVDINNPAALGAMFGGWVNHKQLVMPSLDTSHYH